MNRHSEIYALPDARAHHSLAGYLAKYSACSPAEAETILASARAGGGIVLPPLAAWTSNSESHAASHRERLSGIYGDRLDTRAAEAAPAAPGVSTTSAEGWAGAFSRTAARLPDEQPQEAAATSMRQAMDAAIARMKGETA